MSSEHQSEADSVTILTIGYRTHCTEPGCRNLARALIRDADRGGRPLSNLERCNAHTREALERAAKAGLAIYDNRSEANDQQ